MRDEVGAGAVQLGISNGWDRDKALCAEATVYYALVTGTANCEVCHWSGPVVKAH